MKKILRIIYTSLFIACCACFLLACIDPIEPPAPQNTAVGEGTFSLVIGSENESRTILPTTTQSSFVAYTLVFKTTGKDDVSANRTSSNLSSSVTLAAATWDLTVTAYMDSARTKPAAQGTLANIVINAGASVSRNLELKPIIESGAAGTFSWNINYPSEVTIASMKITPLDAATGTSAQTFYFIGGNPSVSKNNTSSPLSLNTGYYRVEFSLSNGQHETGREEYLHVYKNMDSRFTYTFSQDHFTVYSVTNGNDSGPGSLRHAITNAASGGVILIENGVGTISLTSRLSINKNLTIAGNGVTITRHSSWTANDDNSQLLYISGSAATVTISRVHFRDGRGTSGSAVSVSSGSLNLESCIFSGNQGRNGTIYTGSGITLNVKGSTFYGNNVSGAGGAILNFGKLTLTGNLFFGNTASTYPAIRNSGTVTSDGYNVVDLPLGTTAAQSGWTGLSIDKTISGIPISPVNFKLLSNREAQNVIASRPGAYPTTDFYGNSIPASNAAAGAVQAVASGYLVDVSVNNSALGSAAITSAPLPNTDGLYNGGSVTLTANSTGPAGYDFQYWQVNNGYNTANPLNLQLTNHYRVQAVFGKKFTNSVQKVLFSGPTETVTLNGLSNNEIFLVKVNMSALIVEAANTGISPSLSRSVLNNVMPLPVISTDDVLPRMGHPSANILDGVPMPSIADGPRKQEAVAGSTRSFWIEQNVDKRDWIYKPATLLASGTYGNIWVMDNCIGSEQAKALADKFDIIYPAETNLIGYEYGGGPGGTGGKDGELKIQILVYDIGNNIAGFFWSKDFYQQDLLPAQMKTNNAEIFYIDAGVVKRQIDYIYSTLVHEFQHMIHFNQKEVKQNISSASWYNEMLSMMTEDVMAKTIGIEMSSSYHKIRVRMPDFLRYYYLRGITEWTGDFISYAKGIAFGAYLLRNYGGAGLLQEMLANNSTGTNSITAALNKFAGSGINFEEALRRFGEAIVFSGTMPDDVLSFDKTVNYSKGVYTYTAVKFNVWTDFGSVKPAILNGNQQEELRPYSLTVHQDASWKGKTGSFSITLQRPNDPNVEFYLMVK